MKFKNLVNENLILLDLDFTKKEDIIEALVKKLYEDGVLKSKENFYRAVMQREEISPTGLEDGLAIPHGKCDSVITPKIAVARLKNKISTWESVDDDNEVDLVFLIAIPKKEEGDAHIEVLSKLTTSFMKDGFIDSLKNAKTKEEMLNIICSVEKQEVVQEKKEILKTDKVVLAVTACATGIAHTFLAAEALEKAGSEMGVKVYTEKQGASGIEGRFTKELIDRADAVIFAVDVAVKEIDRFEGKKYYQTRVATPLKAGKETIEKALTNPTGIVNSNSRSSKEEIKAEGQGALTELKRAFLTGISYMIPLVIAGAVIMGIARIGGSIFGVTDIWDASYGESGNILVKLFHTMDGLGGRALGLMLPFIAGYVAFALGDRTAIAPGFVGGVLAKELNTGFVGALVAGIIAGYTVKFTIEKIKLPGFASGITSILIAPVLGVLVTGLSMIYVIGDPMAAMNKGLEVWLMGLNGSNQLLLAAIIGAMVGFDLGGPINKAAVTTSMALLASGITIPNTAAQVAIIVPPIGLGLATIIGKNRYNLALQEAGRSSVLMGLVGISEGAIPFAIESPLKVIPINVIGSALASSLAVFLGANNPAPISGFYGWLTVHNWPQYVISIVVGSTFIAIASVFLRQPEIKAEEVAC